MIPVLILATALAAADHPHNQCPWVPSEAKLKEVLGTEVVKAKTLIRYCPDCEGETLTVGPMQLVTVQIDPAGETGMQVMLNGAHFDPVHAYYAPESAPPYSAKSLGHAIGCTPAESLPATITIDADGKVTTP